ncbi:biotin/lipoyl-binding protein [Mesorhizobium sp.]|uniref:biotin/lipoyl-binding protein n=1 Tax=Mesorhizobium sp. TaxID=1871066 RepID=UPI0025C1D27F|nr:biotin/lipoyl-binding protein [Mesorhizobium sp.]
MAGSRQTRSILRAKFSGRIAALLVDEGDVVRAGQLVARMDTQDLEMSLRKAQVLGQRLALTSRSTRTSRIR